MEHRSPCPSVFQSVCAITTALALSAGAIVANAAPADEQATKVAMIYNFSRFTLWPDSRFAGPADPVVLCVEPEQSSAGGQMGSCVPSQHPKHSPVSPHDKMQPYDRDPSPDH